MKAPNQSSHRLAPEDGGDAHRLPDRSCPRLVIARGNGRLTDRDVFGYQREVWSRTDVGGYNEVVGHEGRRAHRGADDGADQGARQPGRRHGSPGSASKFAIVATDEIAASLGQFFGRIGSSMRAAPRRSAPSRAWPTRSRGGRGGPPRVARPPGHGFATRRAAPATAGGSGRRSRASRPPGRWRWRSARTRPPS